MLELKQYTVEIPFCGFYESAATDLIDQEIESAFTDVETDDSTEIPDDFYNKWDHRPVAVAFSKYYVQMFTEYLKDNTGLDIKLFFEELDSPKFYNYETDRIFCKISREDLKKLWAAVDMGELARTVHDRFTDRSGFISHYPNKLSEGVWLKDVTEWDLAQTETLFLALFRQNDIENINYDLLFEDCNCNGELYDIVWNNCSKECLEMANKYHKQAERKAAQ